MKNIFKIALSIMLAFALLLVPMTVMAEDEVNYAYGDGVLAEGTAAYAISPDQPYTVYVLQPTATGNYKVTADGCLIGIVSYTDMWVMNTPSDDIVNQTEVTWKCTDVNQAIIVAIKADMSEVSLTVSRTDLDTSGEIPWTIYENETTPEKLDIYDSIDFDSLDYVDFEDDKIDDAVLGDDGYYHLNDKNGPVLFANLNEEMMSIYAMSGYGKVAAVYYDENDELVKKVDYTDAFNEYVSALPVDASGTITSYWYPLTVDLIEIFKELGGTKKWYSGDEPWIYASEDAWLYACYYDADITTLGDAIDNNNSNNSNNNGGSNTNTNTNNSANSNANSATNNAGNANTNGTTNDGKSPSTGDSTAALAVALISAAALAVATKKAKFNA